MKSAQSKADVETIQRMLVLYYFGPTVVVEEEKKVDGQFVRTSTGTIVKHKVVKEPA